MRLVFGRAHDDLAKHWVLNTTLDHDNNGFIHLIANDFTNERTLTLWLSCLSGGHIIFRPSQTTTYAHARYRGEPYGIDCGW